MSFLESICSAVQHNSSGWGPPSTEFSFSQGNCERSSLDLIATRGDQLGQTADWSLGLTQDRRQTSHVGAKGRQIESNPGNKLFEVFLLNYRMFKF